MSLTVSPAPRVTLLGGPAQPYNTALAAARTCYSSRLIHADEVGATPQSRDLRDRIAKSTFEAGHHTVWQHAHFTFALEGVSRQFIWSFLHAHPFYNSEQVSQRYVEVKPGRTTMPPLPDDEARAVYTSTVEHMHACYAALTEELTPAATDAYFTVFPARRRKAELYAKDIKKKAQEVARYALPVATHAHMYHTISALTLYRYWRLCEQLDAPAEARQVIGAMVDAVAQVDPDLMTLAADPVPLADTLEAHLLTELFGSANARAGDGGAFCKEFDARLEGTVSRLCGHQTNAEALVAGAVRQMLGLTTDQMTDDDAVARVLDPALNPYLGETLRLHTTAKLTRALHHAQYTFHKKLSHTADSQDQRHRMTPASRPVLATQVNLGLPDVVVPALMTRAPAATERYLALMTDVWKAMNRLRDQGADASSWTYLLPNGFPVRFTESGDLAHLHHKWTSRLCFTAQEEIWRASVDEVTQLAKVHPRLGRWLLPPCGLRQRANITPYCPEGTRYCGVPVWKQDVTSYLRVL